MTFDSITESYFRATVTYEDQSEQTWLADCIAAPKIPPKKDTRDADVIVISTVKVRG